MISRLRPAWSQTFSRHPVRLLPVAFAVVIAAGTAVLMSPVSTTGAEGASFVDAVFTATSAVCVVGLTTVDTPVYWADFGHGVILVLVQLGGFGIMAGSTLLMLIVTRRLGHTTRMLAQAEMKTLSLGDVKAIAVRSVVVVTFVEAVVAAALFARFRFGHGFDAGEALWLGVFHSVSSFNSAGFALFSDSFVGYAVDPGVLVPLMTAMFLGGLGAPVLFELTRRRHGWRRWSVHTKLTLAGSGVLLGAGFLFLLAAEWSNPATLGRHDPADRFLPALFHAVTPRSAGLNVVETGDLTGPSLLVTDFLMFIGGGSASTAGGIKVTTFFLLGAVIWTEIRGERDVTLFRRRIPVGAVRQAVSVALLYVGFVAAGCVAMLTLTEFPLDQVLFETISAGATVGLSTGITADLPAAAQLVLTCMMFVGRIGPVAVASALALRNRHRRYRYPEGRPIVG
ncbi:MAG: TrkH family potassium uptake protein [Stackebrandtia sp.]